MLQTEATFRLQCGFYNLDNLDYLLFWLQSTLSGLFGLFKPQIIRNEASNNLHFFIILFPGRNLNCHVAAYLGMFALKCLLYILVRKLFFSED